MLTLSPFKSGDYVTIVQDVKHWELKQTVVVRAASEIMASPVDQNRKRAGAEGTLFGFILAVTISP